MKKSIMLLLVVSLASVSAWSVDYSIDKAHSEVVFKIKHLGISNVTGTFRDFTADFSVDPKNLATLKVKADIDVASIDTDNEKRDKHLRNEDFFDAPKYPKATFVSTKVTNIDDDEFKLHGMLTMHGVTKPVVLDAEFGGTAKDPWGNEHIAFSAETKIDRKDWGLTWNETLDAGGLLLGEQVKIAIELAGKPVKKSEPKKKS